MGAVLEIGTRSQPVDGQSVASRFSREMNTVLIPGVRPSTHRTAQAQVTVCFFKTERNLFQGGWPSFLSGGEQMNGEFW